MLWVLIDAYTDGEENIHNVLGPVKQKISARNCDYFLKYQFKHVFWVLKRAVSLRRFF